MRIRYAAYVAGLAVGWVILGDRVSPANLLGGAVVAAVILATFPLPPVPAAQRRMVRPLALVRLAGVALHDVASSNWIVARQIVRRKHQLHTGVVACPMRTASPKVLSTVSNVLALSPDTMAVQATSDPPTLYVHVLALRDVDAVRRKVAAVETAVVEALGSAADRAGIRPEKP